MMHDADAGDAFTRLQEILAKKYDTFKDLIRAGGLDLSRDLVGTDLSNVEFSNEDLSDVNLANCNLRQCIFVRTQLVGSCLQGSDLTYAVFHHVNAKRADFSGATLDGAQFVDTDVTRARFEDARIQGAVFDEVAFERAQLSKDQERSALLAIDPTIVAMVGSRRKILRAKAGKQFDKILRAKAGKQFGISGGGAKGIGYVTLSDVAAATAQSTGLSQTQTSQLVGTVFDTIASALRSGSDVRVVGFGTFSVTERGATEGRNPRTGQAVKIPAAKALTFKPGKSLKEALD